jgi:hypothetical protein
VVIVKQENLSSNKQTNKVYVVNKFYLKQVCVLQQYLFWFKKCISYKSQILPNFKVYQNYLEGLLNFRLPSVTPEIHPSGLSTGFRTY